MVFLLLNRPMSNTTWPIYLPIVFIIGVAIAIWGGIVVNNQVKSERYHQLVLESEKKTADISVKWSLLDGAMQSYRSLIGARTGLSNSNMSAMTNSLATRIDALKYVAVFDGKLSHKFTPVLSYSATGLDSIDNHELADALDSKKSFFKNFDKLSILPIHLKNKSHPEHYVWAVVPLNKDNGRIVILIDLYRLMGPNFALQAEHDTAPDIRISFVGDNSTFHVYDHDTNNHKYDHKSLINIGGAQWILGWNYNKDSAGDYNWGIIFSAVVLLITMFLIWILWTQYTISALIRSEVITRTKELEQASRRFRLITDNAYDLIAIVSIRGDFEYINSAYNRVLGYSRKLVFGQSILDFVHEDDGSYLKKAIDAVINGRPVSEVSFRMRSKKNDWIHLEAVAKGIFDNSWNLTSIVIHCRDVTARKKYADELARSEQRFKDFADSSADWLWEVSNDFVFSYVSPGVKSTLGYTPQDMMGCTIFDALFANGDNASRELLEGLAKRHQPYRELEFWTRTKMGERVCLRLSGIPVFDKDGNFSGYRGAATNITASKIDRENMLRLATTDHLTGLLNRNRFMEELEHTIALSRRHNTEGVVLFIDLDRFKVVNDTHGHEAGDLVIKDFSSVLKKSVRSTDIISRIAGDEFAVIMHNVDIKKAAEKVSELIACVNKMRVDYKGTNLQVTISVGMAGYPQAGKDASQILTSADLAMYKAKDMGRNRLYIDEGMLVSDKNNATMREQLEWIDRLRESLDKDKFEMHFQPIVPCNKGSHVIYEALIRLRDENGKLGAPALFIDAAEHFGMIRDLDKAVVERCIKMQAELSKKDKNVVLSINLSGMSFGDNELLQCMKKFFKKYKADPTKFIFEVTETAAMRDINEAQSFVSGLKKMGSKFALDDFGVGFSSFFYIKHLEVDYIKIDGSYIRNLDTSSEDRLFVKSLVDLASGLGIETVAEFVENQSILDELKNMNVTYAQGFHLSKPEKDIEALFDTFDNTEAGVKKSVKKLVAKKPTKPKSSKGDNKSKAANE